MSGPTVTVRLPNGHEIDVQTSDPAVAAKAAQQHWARSQGEQQAAPKPRSGLQTAGDFLGDTVDNIAPNWGDEIAAIPDAIGGAFSGEGIGEAFNRGRGEFRENQAQYDEEHPNLAWASTLTGMGAGMALPVGNLARGASLGAKALQGVRVGAVYGGVAGAGDGDSLSARFNNTATGALTGATMGAAATPALTGLARAGRFVRQSAPGVAPAVRTLRNVPRAVLGRAMETRRTEAQANAERLLASRMSEGTIQEGFGRQGAPASPENILSELRRRQSLGVPAMPGDTTDAMRGLTSWASRGMGPGQSRVREVLDARKASEAARVRQHVVETFGPAVDPVTYLGEQAQRTRAAAGPGYREAYAQPMTITDPIAQIMRTPAFRGAIPQAVRNIENSLGDPNALGFRLHDDGSMMVGETLSFEGFDQVVRAMKQTAQDAAKVNPVTGRPIHTSDSVHINARASDLRGHLADQNEAYRDVTTRYADDMAEREAFTQGQDMRKLTGHELEEVRRSMPDNAQEAWATGARTALADDASRFGARYPTGDTAAHIRTALGDDTKQRAISELTGNTGAVRGLQDRLEAEHQGNILWSEVRANSKTAPRQQADKELDEAAGFMSLSSLTPRGMLTGVINRIAAGATDGARNDVKARIAELATETNVETVEELMAAIAARVERDRDFGNALHRAGLFGTKPAAAKQELPEPSGNRRPYSTGEDGSRWFLTEDGTVESEDGTIGFPVDQWDAWNEQSSD